MIKSHEISLLWIFTMGGQESPSPYGMNPGNLWAPGLKNGDDRFCHIHLPYFFQHPEMGAVF